MTPVTKDPDVLVRQAMDTIAGARMDIYERFAFFIATLYNMKFSPVPGMGTLATDEGLRVFYDPEFVSAQKRKHAITVLFHELGHHARDHFGRYEAFKLRLDAIYRPAAKKLEARYGIRTVRELWNWGGDCEINDDFQKLGLGWPDGFKPVEPGSLGLALGKTAEQYCADIVASVKDWKPPKDHQAPSAGGHVGGGQCGGCAGNPSKAETDADQKPDAPKKLTTSESQVLRKAVAEAIVKQAKSQPGTVPGSWARWAEEEVKPPKIDWRRSLPAHVRKAVSWAAGATDYTWRRPSRRAGGVAALFPHGRAPILPRLNKPVPRVGVGVDTSGSMNKARIEAAAAEVLGIVKAVGRDVIVFGVDTEVQAAAKVKTAADLKKVLKGGGGTRMESAVEEGARLGLDVLVVVTDGETAWPPPGSMPRGMRVIVCCVTNQEVPPHVGTVIRVDDVRLTGGKP